MQREKWSSLLSFIWVAAGAAVGLGNIWKFPYMAGSHGGAAFVLMYLFFVLIVAVPVMIAEICLGKLGQRDAVGNFEALAAKNKLSEKWSLVGYLGSLTLFLVFCFYSVIAGFSIAYFYFSLSGKFVSQSPKEIQAIWVSFLADPGQVIFCTFAFVLATMSIVHFGIKKGIERACSWMMPVLLLVLLSLVFYAALGSGFNDAVAFLFAFKPQAVSSSVIISALGHAFFTLAVGACAMMVYGSHLPQNISVIKAVSVVALLDVMVAVLSGLAIFPLIFSHGLSPNEGPGLMFVSLPIVFATIPGGHFLGALFFLLLFFAALSSALSFAEPLVDLVMAKKSIIRPKANVFVGVATFMVACLCALSFNLLADLKIFGRFTIFDWLADFSTNLLLPLGGIAIAVFAGHVLKPADIFSGRYSQSAFLYAMWRFMIKIVAPLAILIVLVNGLKELFRIS